MPSPTVEKWLEISETFYEKTNFPNGAVDGKQEIKNVFSIVLMAVVDANYCFTVIDVGSYCREGDTNISKQSSFGKFFKPTTLYLFALYKWTIITLCINRR